MSPAVSPGLLSAINTAVLAACLLALSAGVWWLAFTFAVPREPPTEVHGAGFLTDIAKPGDNVVLWVERTRNRICPGEATEWWRQGERYVRGATTPLGAARDLGLVRNEFLKEVPKEIDKPGRWCYEPLLMYECQYRRYAVHQPPSCLEIVLP